MVTIIKYNTYAIYHKLNKNLEIASTLLNNMDAFMNKNNLFKLGRLVLDRFED